MDSFPRYLQVIYSMDLWKYPGVCHFCGQDRCLCVLHEEAIETRHEKEEIDEYLVKGLREVKARREHFDDLY